jgi:hypothetical protein
MTTPPTRKEINDVLERLDEGKWVSDAEREGLPTTNVYDSGAPRLDVDATLRRTTPTYNKENHK